MTISFTYSTYNHIQGYDMYLHTTDMKNIPLGFTPVDDVDKWTQRYADQGYSIVFVSEDT